MEVSLPGQTLYQNRRHSPLLIQNTGQAKDQRPTLQRLPVLPLWTLLLRCRFQWHWEEAGSPKVVVATYEPGTLAHSAQENIDQKWHSCLIARQGSSIGFVADHCSIFSGSSPHNIRSPALERRILSSRHSLVLSCLVSWRWRSWLVDMLKKRLCHYPQL